MAIFSNKRLLGLAAALVGMLLAVSGLVYAGSARGGDSGNGQEDEPTEKANYMRGKAAIDPKNERQIVGVSSDIFFGRVVEQSGSEAAPSTGPGAGLPMSQFAVEVTEVIKGDASGTATVNQVGGYVDDNAKGGKGKQLHLIEGDPLLEPGQEYLSATKYVPKKGWHQLVLSGAADVKVKDRAQRKDLKEKFEKAKANQEGRNLPSKEGPSAEEKAKRTYNPCNPDRPSMPCDPSDPLPPGKSGDSSGQPESPGQQK